MVSTGLLRLAWGHGRKDQHLHRQGRIQRIRLLARVRYLSQVRYRPHGSNRHDTEEAHRTAQPGDNAGKRIVSR